MRRRTPAAVREGIAMARAVYRHERLGPWWVQEASYRTDARSIAYAREMNRLNTRHLSKPTITDREVVRTAAHRRPIPEKRR